MDLYSFCVCSLESMYSQLFNEYIEYYNTVLYRRDFDNLDMLRLIELMSQLEYLKNVVYPRILAIAHQYGVPSDEKPLI